MTLTPRTSDDYVSEEQLPVEFADILDDIDDLDWDADPAAILERRELESGINCFDQPIN